MTADSEPTDGLPRVWVIGDDRPGDTTQSIGLAQALGYPFVFKRLQFNRWARIQRIVLALFGRVGADLRGVDRARSDPLGPPWPDIAIGSVWRTAPVVRWIARQSRGRTRTIQLGRKGAESAMAFDAVVTPAYWRLLPHPRRVETVLPLHRVSPAVLAAARGEWAGLFGDAPRPRVALLVGGSTGGGFYRLDGPAARDMALAVRAFAESAGGAVFAIGSRRTGAAAEAVLTEILIAPHHFTPWRPDHPNPYLGHLALADAIVVTGESESMLAEAAATGKPVYIYDLPHRAPGLVEDMLDAIALRARRHILAGTARPFQTRLVDRICAWLVGRGVIRPPRDLGELHRMLVARGVGFAFGAPFATHAARFDEAAEVASRVRQMLLLPDPPASGVRAGEPSRSET
jgi:mitochondrial fission protein ELM1